MEGAPSELVVVLEDRAGDDRSLEFPVVGVLEDVVHEPGPRRLVLVEVAEVAV
jgi:hypothetical protein